MLFVLAQGHPATNVQWSSVYIISSDRFQEVGPISTIFMGEYSYRIILLCVHYLKTHSYGHVPQLIKDVLG